MPEAVIVATARSPIGRAMKGSLVDVRPDDLAATIVQAVLDKVPGLDPADPGRPDARLRGAGGEAGRQHGPPGRRGSWATTRLPGTTVNRFCASSVQTSRMAFHAIKAGEGHAFVSAGVECVSQYPAFNGRRRRARGVPQPRLRRGAGPDRGDRRARTRPGATRARTACCPTSTSRWARPPRTWPRHAGSPGPSRTSSGSARRTWPRRRSRTASSTARSRRSPRPTGTVVSRDDGPRPGVTLEGVSGLRAGVPRARARSPPATAARSTTAPRPS